MSTRGNRHNHKQYAKRNPVVTEKKVDDPPQMKLYIEPTKYYFKQLLVHNCTADAFDKEFYNLRTIMESTFAKGKPLNTNAVKKFNGNTPCGAYIPLGKDTFNDEISEIWLKLYYDCLVENKFPEYTMKWLKPILWMFDNIHNSIDGIDRAKAIKKTKNLSENGHLMMDHEEYERYVEYLKNYRKTIHNKINDVITKNNTILVETRRMPLTIPILHDNAETYQFYAVRIAWLLVTLRGDDINFGNDLNSLTEMITTAKKYTVDKYITALRILREHGRLEELYGDILCRCIARLIENTMMYHCFKRSFIMYIKQFMIITMDYLESQQPRKCFIPGDDTMKDIILLKNRYTPDNQASITMILQTYPSKDLEAYLLKYFFTEYIQPSINYREFQLLKTLYDPVALTNAFFNGFKDRERHIQISQIATGLMVELFNVETIKEMGILDDAALAEAFACAIYDAPRHISSMIMGRDVKDIFVKVYPNASGYLRFCIRSAYKKADSIPEYIRNFDNSLKNTAL